MDKSGLSATNYLPATYPSPTGSLPKSRRNIALLETTITSWVNLTHIGYQQLDIEQLRQHVQPVQPSQGDQSSVDIKKIHQFQGQMVGEW